MSEETARAALEEALTDLLEQGQRVGAESTVVSPTAHEIDTLRLSDLAAELRDGYTAPVEIIWRDGNIGFRVIPHLG